LWDVKDVIREQRGVEVVEKGSIDSGKEYLQIIMSAFEPKFGENGEDKACGRRQRSACWFVERSRGTELKTKGFEFGHHCQGSDHRVE